jgi:hypothetical protein
MNKLCFILVGVMLLTSNCKSFSQVAAKKDIIIDPVIPSPYSFSFNPNVTLPDSLGGNRYKGYAWVEGDISENLNISQVKIIRLYLFDQKGDTILHYYYGQDSLSTKYIYPSNVERYIPFIQECMRSVKIVKIKGITGNKNVRYGVRLRFNSNWSCIRRGDEHINY